MTLDDECPWGWDTTPGIVSVWAEPDGRTFIWRRLADTGQLVREEAHWKRKPPMPSGPQALARCSTSNRPGNHRGDAETRRTFLASSVFPAASAVDRWFARWPIFTGFRLFPGFDAEQAESAERVILRPRRLRASAVHPILDTFVQISPR